MSSKLQISRSRDCKFEEHAIQIDFLLILTFPNFRADFSTLCAEKNLLLLGSESSL